MSTSHNTIPHKDSDIPNPIYGAPGFYNAERTRWDDIISPVQITRPSYWLERIKRPLKPIHK